MKSKVNELLESVSKIENGTITLPELEYTVELSRDLYEKLVVIRHKVYEQGILEQPAFDLSPIAFEEETPTTEFVPAEPVESDFFEPEMPEIEVENKTETSLESESIDSPEGTSEPEFDISTEEASSDVTEDNLFDRTIEMESDSTDFSDDLERPQPEIQYNESPVVHSGDSASWVDKIKEIENNIPSSFTMSKLDTLIGSFGLNERLQFINELFGGSSEAFSEAVKVLDARTGMDSARDKMAEFAAGNSWEDADSDTISDFVAKIKRRYA